MYDLLVVIGLFLHEHAQWLLVDVVLPLLWNIYEALGGAC